MNSITTITSNLLSSVRSCNYAGYDPFDALNSKLLRATPLYKIRLARLAWLQFSKRSPINFRPIFMVPKGRNPKGIGLFILGLLEDFRRTGEKQFLKDAIELAEWLLDTRCPREKWEHNCWGYHFDWEARAFYVPKGVPNIITTCYVARALFELGQATSEERYIDHSLDAALFISKKLYVEQDNRKFYAYIPGEKAFVHNASLWGAAWCAFAGKRLGDSALIEQALRVARQSANEQTADGSWVYGARHHHQFIDGFHTGYNLEALNLLRNTLGTDEFDDCIDKGYRYYVNTFFTENGTAKYYNNSIYPIDMHSFAQSLFTLLKVGGTRADLELCDKVVKRAVDLLYLPHKGQFIYQRTRWLTNKINYIRWTQAWAYYSLSFYNRYRAELDHAKN